MATQPLPPAMKAELSELEEVCARAARDLATSRTVRETLALAEVTVPHHLQAIARGRVHSLTRLPRVRDMRVEEVVQQQLAELKRERSEVVASRAFDRIKAADWTALRSAYPELYAKALRQANLILEQKQRSAR